MTDTWIDNGTELGFSTKLFNKININMPQVSFWEVLINNIFGQPISHPQLNWISDRKLEKLASSTWSPCCRLIWVVYEIFWMKNQNQLVNWSDTQKIYVVLHGRHLALLCWYWNSWLYLECSQDEICVIITRSACNHCCLHSNHHSPCLHGFRGSRCPQHYLSWCCCTRSYAWMISWLNGRLRQYKQLPSLSRAMPSSPCSAPEVWVVNALTQHVSEMQFFFFAFQL